ncbi:MAG: phytanoyl-CoA dioxygenase family protein [Bdellovibrionota bacterium]
MNIISSKHPEWKDYTLRHFSESGYSIVTDVFSRSEVNEIKERMYSVQSLIESEIGQQRLQRAGEKGVLRLMMKYDPFFTSFLENAFLLQVVDHVLGNTCIMHLQNGFILPKEKENEKKVFQTTFHRDFNRNFNGLIVSVNALVTISEFSKKNGGTLILPGSHQNHLDIKTLEQQIQSTPIECPEGSIVFFDSTLVHAAGQNLSNNDRLAINHQFTKSYFKQQIDYVRALGDNTIEGLTPRTQQLLGWYTRVVTSLDEYYQPSENRLYRSGQG